MLEWSMLCGMSLLWGSDAWGVCVKEMKAVAILFLSFFVFFFLFSSAGWGFVAEHMKAALMQLVASWWLMDYAMLWLSPQSSIFRCDSELIADYLTDNDSADSARPFSLFLWGLPCSSPAFSLLFSTPYHGFSLRPPSLLCFSLSHQKHNHCHKPAIWQEMAISLARLGLWCC